MARHLEEAVSAQIEHAARMNYLVDDLLAAERTCDRREQIERLNAFLCHLCVHGRTALGAFAKSQRAFAELQALVRAELAAAGSHAALRRALRARWPCSCRKAVCSGRRSAAEIDAELEGPLAELIAERDRCDLLALPNEVLVLICAYLPPHERCLVRGLCRRLRAVVHGSTVDWLRASGALRLSADSAPRNHRLVHFTMCAALYTALAAYETGNKHLTMNILTEAPAIVTASGEMQMHPYTMAGRWEFNHARYVRLMNVARDQPELLTTAVGIVSTYNFEKIQRLAHAVERAEKMTVSITDVDDLNIRVTMARARLPNELEMCIIASDERLPFARSVHDIGRMMMARRAHVDAATRPACVSDPDGEGWTNAVRDRMYKSISANHPDTGRAIYLTANQAAAELAAAVEHSNADLLSVRHENRAAYLGLIRRYPIWHLPAHGIERHMQMRRDRIQSMINGSWFAAPPASATVLEVVREQLRLQAEQAATPAYQALAAAVDAVENSPLLERLACAQHLERLVLQHHPAEIVLEDALWLLRSIATDDEFDALAAVARRKRPRDDDDEDRPRARPRLE